MADEKFYSRFTEKKNKAKNSKNEKASKGDAGKSTSLKSAAANKASNKSIASNSVPNKNASNKGENKRDRVKSKAKVDYKPANSYEIKNQLFNSKIGKDEIKILENFDELIQGVKPLNSKQMQQLPENIKALSHQLTDERSERRLGYMNENIQLSAYVRYYTWWNLVRLTKLLANLPEKAFPAKDGICLDLGSGPLTVICALWLARPELRKLKLTWYCLDVSANSMSLGEDVYLSLAAKTFDQEPWKIIRVKGSFGTGIKQKADFITCANMFNELDQNSQMPPEYQTKKYFDQLQVYGTQEAKYLLIEPGVPKAARTLSLLRERFIKNGNPVLAPCPHSGDCPMNGFKAYTGSQNKWCNFAFSTEDAPAKLLKLSERAKLPKERATLSFICIGSKNSNSQNNANENSKELLCRVNSDPFRLPQGRTGFYACSSFGLTLLSVKTPFIRHEEDKPAPKYPLTSGDLVQVKIKTPDSLPKDEKSGAIKIEL